MYKKSIRSSIFHNHDSPALVINGFVDHVHILSSLSRTITIAKLTEEVKRSASKWIKSKGTRFEKFYWQTGYAVFGIGRHNIENVKMYILNQKIHHRRRTFKKEYIEFLKKYAIAYDERYIWE